MADTIKKPAVKPAPQPQNMDIPPKPSSKRRILKILIVCIVLIMLAGVGFALGVYLKLVNMDNLTNELKLYNYPIIGRYFTKAATNFEPVDLDAQNPAPQPGNAVPAPATPAASQALPDNKLLPGEKEKELEKLMKAKQLEETKRIAKLARLYGSMKPDEAVPILNQLDDDTVLAVLNKMDDEQVAKILALLDAKRSARLTQQMLKGKNNNNSL